MEIRSRNWSLIYSLENIFSKTMAALQYAWLNYQICILEYVCYYGKFGNYSRISSRIINPTLHFKEGLEETNHKAIVSIKAAFILWFSFMIDNLRYVSNKTKYHFHLQLSRYTQNMSLSHIYVCCCSSSPLSPPLFFLLLLFVLLLITNYGFPYVHGDEPSPRAWKTYRWDIF